MYNVFDMGIMANESVQAWVGTCKFGTDDSGEFIPAEAADGAFVVLGDLAEDEVYVGEPQWNTNYAYAPDGSNYTVDDIVVIDLPEVMGGTIGGNYYKLGVKTVGLIAEANLPIRYRRLKKHDRFWLGAGCFTATPTVHEYAELTSGGEVTLTPTATAPEAFGVKILGSKPLTQGNLVAYQGNAYLQAYYVEVL